MKDFTIKEIADLTQVVKSTVRNAINKLELECDYIEPKSKAKYFSWEKTKKIIEEIKPGMDFSSIEKEETTLTAEPVLTSFDTENPGNELPNAVLRSQIDRAEIERLRTKAQYLEEMIKQLNSNIEDLRRENNTLINDKNLQRLELSDLKEQLKLIEVQEEPGEQQKTFFEKLKYLFGK